MKVIILLVCLQGVLGASLVNRAPCSPMCTMEFSPMCGSDGVSYGNPCMLNYAICMDPSVTLKHPGSCGGGSGARAAQPCPAVMCMMLYDPVCGTDGKTYSNECMMHSGNCNSDVSVAHRGTCA